MAKTRIHIRKNGLQERAKETINYIYEATIQLLQEKGMGQVTTNKIVERAGISIGTLYQYFPNKESIIHNLMERLFTHTADDMVETIRSLGLEGRSLEEAIDLLIARFFKNHMEKKAVLGQFFFSMVSAQHLQFMLKNDAKITAALKEIFGPYKEQARIEDWDLSIFVLLYAIKGIQFGSLMEQHKFGEDKVREEIHRLVYHYLKMP